MKLCLQNKPLDEARTGKGKFAQRLIPALESLGVEIVGRGEKCDIDLQFGKYGYDPYKKAKSIIRLGPAHTNTGENWKKCNAVKWKSVKHADGVIYQSQYSRKVCRKFLGKPKCKDVVIPNGAPRPEVCMPAEVRVNFLASTRKWLPQKRLKDIVKAFETIAEPDWGLTVCGNTLGKYREGLYDRGGKLWILGDTRQVKLDHLYAWSTALIHPVYIDACPNSVVEALVAGCPVICTDQGGTKELVCDSGVPHAVIADEPFKFKPFDHSKPPHVDVHSLAAAMRMFAGHKRDSGQWAQNLEIHQIAKRYVDFFKEVLG